MTNYHRLSFFTEKNLTAIGTFFVYRHIPRRKIALRIFLTAVKYSFTHGGKDGFPYPVDKEVYDNSIQTIKDALDQARIKKDEKLKAIKRLDDFIS